MHGLFQGISGTVAFPLPTPNLFVILNICPFMLIESLGNECCAKQLS